MEMLLSLLVKLTKMPEQNLRPILGLFELVEAPANDILLAPGTVCPKVWFVGSGSLRAYYHIEECKRKKRKDEREKISREVTNWIIPPGGLYTSVQSFSQQIPTMYYVETLEASRLFTLSYPNYLALQKSHPEIVLKIYEHVIVMSELRLHICNLHYPEDRLRMFELTYPGKTSHLTVNVKATYLNIDPSTLSRWRGKIK